MGVDQPRERELCAHISGRLSGGWHPLRTEPSMCRSHVSPHSLLSKVTCIKGPFFTVTLWKIVGFWVYTVEWPSENRFGLLNRMREKGNILGSPETDHGLPFTWCITLKVYGIWRQIF